MRRDKRRWSKGRVRVKSRSRAVTGRTAEGNVSYERGKANRKAHPAEEASRPTEAAPASPPIAAGAALPSIGWT